MTFSAALMLLYYGGSLADASAATQAGQAMLAITELAMSSHEIAVVNLRTKIRLEYVSVS